MEHHHAYQHTNSGSLKRGGERKESKRIFEEVKAEDFTNLMQNVKLNIQDAH